MDYPDRAADRADRTATRADDRTDRAVDHSDHDLLIRLDEKVNQLLDQFAAYLKNQTDHETRLRALEQWKWKMVGIAAGAGAVATLVVNWLKSKPL